MKKKIYLHIGTFKTGTSSIQQYLKIHSGWLESQGYFVPQSGLVGHHDLPLSLIKEFTQFRAPWPAFDGTWEDIWGNVISQIERTSCSKIIISSENFCDIVNEHARVNSNKIADVLTQYFKPYDVVVIAYIRKLNSYVQSMYREAVKVGQLTRSMDEILKSYLAHKSIHIHPSIYLDFYSKIFGKKNIAVKLYSTDLFEEGDVVMDFLSLIGVTANGRPSTNKEQANVSLSANATQLKRIFNIFGAQGYEHNKNISNALIKLDQVLSGDGDAKLSKTDEANIKSERDYMLSNYNVDIGFVDDISNSRDKDLSETEAFIISLLSLSIKQNINILTKMNNIEKLLLDLGKLNK